MDLFFAYALIGDDSFPLLTLFWEMWLLTPLTEILEETLLEI